MILCNVTYKLYTMHDTMEHVIYGTTECNMIYMYMYYIHYIYVYDTIYTIYVHVPFTLYVYYIYMILYTCNTWYDMILLARCPSVVLRQPKSERERLRGTLPPCHLALSAPPSI